MRAFRAGVAALLVASPAWGQGAPAGTPSPAAPPTPAANLAALQPCGARAARYEGAKGFSVAVIRIGRASVENPLRPLTPEVTQVLQVAISGRLATAYGPDLGTLRRGGGPAALEAQLGAPIRWEAALPVLPDPLPIVGEDGTPLATLAFRDCTDPPPVKAEAVRKVGGKDGGKGVAGGKGAESRDKEGRDKPRPAKSKAEAPKTPPGFQLPQGAIGE